MKIKEEVSAGGIVYKKDKGRILWLICQHSQHKGWVFPKGLVGDHNPNETKETAALREVNEEGGVKTKIVNPNPVITHYQYVWGGKLIKKTVYYFLMEYISGDPKNHDWEMSEAKFVPQEKVNETLTYQSDKKAFVAILNSFSSSNNGDAS